MVEMLSAMRRYADFSGRTNRKEYWLFVAGSLILALALAQLKSIFINIATAVGMKSHLSVHTAPHFYAVQSHGPMQVVLLALNLLQFILIASLMIADLSALVRRLHDTGRGAVWSLLLGPGALAQISGLFYGFIISQSYFGNARLAGWLLVKVANNPLGGRNWLLWWRSAVA